MSLYNLFSFASYPKQPKILGSTVSQYEINDKILRILPAKWRAQETALKTSKDLEAMPWKNW